MTNYAKTSSQRAGWPRSVSLEMALEQRAIGRRIAQLRERRHLTQPVTADKIGVSLRAYQAWESGDSTPRWPNMTRLAEVLQVRVEEIVGEDEPIDLANDQERLDRIEAKLDKLLEAVVEVPLTPGAAEISAREPALEPEDSSASRDEQEPDQPPSSAQDT